MKTKLIFFASILAINSLRLVAQPNSIDYFGQTPPGDIPIQFATGIVTGYIHGNIAISSKGNEIYWVVKSTSERILHSKIENGIWTTPVVADFVKDFMTYNNGSPVFSPDGNKIFFYSDRTGGKGGYDTWCVDSISNGKNIPINVGEPYNSPDNDLTPLLTNKGNAYCVRSNKNHQYNPVCYKYSNNKFTDPVAMDIIPDYGPWWSIYVSPDEDYLIFSGKDDADLYIRFKDKLGRWGNPISMGVKINSKEWERFPVVSPDGKYLFFTRGGSYISNLFWVSANIIEELRKQAFTSAIGIENPDSHTIEIYPNPSSGVFNINIGEASAKNAKVEIYDFSGKMVLANELNKGVVDLSSYSKGIYVAKISQGMKVFTEKLIKR